MKLNLNRLPRRIMPTTDQKRAISGALHLRAQLEPDDPNKLATADGAQNSWGGALMWELGRLLQDSPGFLIIGSLALGYLLILEPLISLLGWKVLATTIVVLAVLAIGYVLVVKPLISHFSRKGEKE